MTDNAAAAAAAVTTTTTTTTTTITTAATTTATASHRILFELYAMLEACSAALAVTRREHTLSQL